MPQIFQPAIKVAQGPTSSGSMSSRRVDTSGSREHDYETKLLSLFYFRAIQDDTIEQFELVKNNEWVKEFSDIRFKIKIKWHDKPGTVFVQALHKTNKEQIVKIDLAPYFDSYMKIRRHFGPSNKDSILRDTFDETEWLFVIYTNANVDTQFSESSAKSDLSAKLNDILDTGGTVKHLNNEEKIEYVAKKTVKNQVISLAKTIACYIDDEPYFQMMSEELILRYHVILARKVFDLSDILSLDAPPYRIASFRQDFFHNTEEYIMLFRDTLYLEIIKRRKLKPSEIQLLLTDFLSDPTDASRLSKLIGTVITYNNGHLEFDKQSTEAFRPNMKPMNVPLATVNKAVELAAIEILSPVKFKVPAAFGNKDLTIIDSDAEIEGRINHLTLKMKELLDQCEASKIVEIGKPLADGFLKLKGGIAGAIGNIFVLDENTNLMKIKDNWESSSTLAQRLYKKLNDVIDNLHEYKFCFKGVEFPELSFDSYGEKIARDFLNNLLVYCNQAEENDLQEILKSEIEDIQSNEPNYFQIKSDAIFLRYHNEIQEWRMHQYHDSYIQERIKLFRQSIEEILFNSLISLISEPFIDKIKKYDYTFTEDAVRSLNLPDQPSSTIVVTENCVLTVVKVLQHIKNRQEHYVVLVVEYIASLPANDRNALRAELRNTNQEDVLILVCDEMDFRHEKTLENIANAVRNKKIIVILNQKSLGILNKYFSEADNILHDKKFSLVDIDIQSQKSILNTATAIFPGVEIKLGVFLRGWPRTDHASTAAGGTTAVADQCSLLDMGVDSKHSKPNSATSVTKCYICGKVGHKASTCYQRRDNKTDRRPSSSSHGSKSSVSAKPKDTSSVTCFRCKSRGHYANRCPAAAQVPGNGGAGGGAGAAPEQRRADLCVVNAPTGTVRHSEAVVCYYGSWATYRSGQGKCDVTDINPKLCTHLIYAFAGLDTQGNVFSLDPYLDLPDNCGRDNYGKFNDLKNQNKNLKTLLAVGGWNEGSAKFSTMAASSSMRQNFINSSIKLMTKHGFDGLDLDWEYPNRRDTVHGVADVDNFTTLLKEVRIAFDRRGLLLTAAVSATRASASQSYNVKEISKYLDLINIMAYDMNGAWDPVTGHNAPLHRGKGDENKNARDCSTVEQSLKYWIDEGCPPAKIALGVPFYGRTFKLRSASQNGVRAPSSGDGITGPYTAQSGFIGYNEFCHKLQMEPWTKKIDPLAKVPYAFKGRDWVSYDDAKSITAKIKYAKQLNVNKIMVWGLETDDFRGLCGDGTYPLLKAINEGLGN